MDTTMAMARLAGAVEHQVLVTGGDPDVEDAARALLSALEPAVRQLAYDLAEQAAAEVASQLPAYEVDVVLAAGEPALRVRQIEAGESAQGSESLDARITLRLPPTLKDLVETAAEERGESLNTWLLKTLSTRAGEGGRRRSRSVTGTIDT
ncbi:MAG TPA: toxin-antitoxin system HicB family antitoxin [Acidimicrobiia bacterium]